MEIEVSLYPTPFDIFGINVGLSVVVSWAVLALFILALVAIRFRIKRFTPVPKGMQVVLETIVGGMERFAQARVGHHARLMAPFTMSLMCYVALTTMVELFGIPPSTEDINCTVALGLASFIAMNVAGFRAKGFRGRVNAMATPSAVALPIRVLTDCIAPFSMGIRLFSNVLVGGVVMQLIYAVVPLVLPSALAIYFNVLHVGIQTFVFGLLSLTYAGEAVE